ncbi:hypothetical protein RS030_81244 [Cryptosporidium xiaoi]|uniref:Uncharacterized protein n=1 Tax=Cryptosporidium xiaoi TaxID=659607 RepID=A0AAV9XTC9_9CRYT
MRKENAVKRNNKIGVRNESHIPYNPKISVLPEHHQLLARCQFREFQLSLGNFCDFNQVDFENRSILTFGIYLFENLIESILCSGTALDKLHELECDIYTHLSEKREGNINLSFKVINTEKKGFTLLPLEYKGLNKKYNNNTLNRDKITEEKREEQNSYEEEQLIPPREYLELIGYKEPVTKSYVFQFPYNSTPEELISEKCIIDLLRRRAQDDEWLRRLERVSSNVSNLAKIILYLIVNYPITYKRFKKEREGGVIFKKLKNPLFYMATMKLLFDEYPNVLETGEELNPKDPGDARRLVNRIRRNKLIGMHLLDINSKLLNSMYYILKAMGGSAWRCNSEYVQYYLHMSFVFDNPNMFSQLSSKNFMFDHDIFEWNYTLNSLSQHIPLLNSFLKPLATSILANRVRNRLSSINEYNNFKREDAKEKESTVFPPLLGSSIEARFLTNEVIKRSKAFFGKSAGERLINSIKKEYDNWQYKSIIQNANENNRKNASNKNSIKEYNQAILVQEKNYRHVKSVISNALPPLSHISPKNKNLQVKIAPGQKYVQSFYDNKINIPKNAVIER